MSFMLQSRHQRNREPWNADELDRLCALITLGKSVPEIAKLFGRSQEAVRCKAQQLGRTRPRAR